MSDDYEKIKIFDKRYPKFVLKDNLCEYDN